MPSQTVLTQALADLTLAAVGETLVYGDDAEKLSELDYHELRAAVRATGADLSVEDEGDLVIVER